MVNCGIDPSFSCTGVAVLNTDTGCCNCLEITTDTSDGHHGKRCLLVARKAFQFVDSLGMTLGTDFNLFIEAPKGQLRGNAQDLPALYWTIVNAFDKPKCTIYEVSPSELSKFLTGKGLTPRVNKVVAVQKKYGHLIPPEFVVDYDTPGGIEKHADVYDSIGLAALGECRLGEGEYSKAQVEAVSKVKSL